MVKKYRKKPIIVEAVQWTGDNYDEIRKFTKEHCYFIYDPNGPDELYIETPEGDMRTEKNDYIIKGKFGEFYVCKEKFFKETYEEV